MSESQRSDPVPTVENARVDDNFSLRAIFIRGASGTFILKVSGTALGFLTALILARLMGVEEYGAFAYAISWASLLIVMAALGFDTLVVKNMAAYQIRSEWGKANGLIWRSSQLVLGASLALVLIGGTGIWLLRGLNESSMLHAVWLALVAVPLVALTRLRQAIMRGLGYTVLGQLPELLFQPILFLILIGGAYLWRNYHPAAPQAILFYITTIAAAFLLGAALLSQVLPKEIKRSRREYHTAQWLRNAMPLIFLTGALIINQQADIILLGFLRGAEDAGRYNVATKGAALVTFVLVAVNMPLAPIVARLYAAGEMLRLQRIVVKSARVVLAFSLPIALGLIVFGDWFLMLFGPEFVGAHTALTFLCLAQLVNGAAGSVGIILTMTNHEREMAKGIGVAAAFNITLNLILIPPFGTTGAAIATAISMVCCNVLLMIWVYRKLGIYTTAFGVMREQ